MFFQPLSGVQDGMVFNLGGDDMISFGTICFCCCLQRPVIRLTSSGCKIDPLRGLHFQRRHSQDKLVRALSGEVYDVAVDIRPASPTFGKWQGFYLTAEDRQMLYIPKGFAHGFLVCSEQAVLHYLCGDRYDPDSENGILWNDPELAIDWPLDEAAAPILSERDRSFQSFATFRKELRAV